MAMFNIFRFSTRCPQCGNESEMDAEFRFGLVNLDTYRIGDTIKWSDKGRGLRSPKIRPVNGDYTGEGYVVCPVCEKDFWVSIVVESDCIVRVDIDASRPGYIK